MSAKARLQRQNRRRRVHNWVEGLAQIFARVALYQVRGVQAKLVCTHGVDDVHLGTLTSLVDATPLRWTVEAASPIVGSGKAPGGARLAQSLGLSRPRAYAVLPLLVKDRIVALAYVDNHNKPLPVATVGDLFQFCGRVALNERAAQPKSRPCLRSTARKPGPRRVRPVPLQVPTRVQNPVHHADFHSRLGIPKPKLVVPTPALSLAPEAIPEPEIEIVAHDDQVDGFDLDGSMGAVTEAPTASNPLATKVAMAKVPQVPPEIAGAVWARSPNREPWISPLPAYRGPTYRTDIPVENLPPKEDMVVTPEGAVAADRMFEPAYRAVAGGVLSAAAVMLMAAVWLVRPTGAVEELRQFEIAPQSSVTSIAKELHDQGLVANPTAFRILARLTGAERELKAGIYELQGEQWAFNVLDHLRTGQVHTATVTIPEGLTLREVGRLLHKEGLVSESRFLKAARDPQFLAELGIPAPSLEGFLFPETYRLAKGLDERQILTAMVEEFKGRVSQLNGGSLPTGQDLHRAVVLASIVEREAAYPGEVDRIAGVFHNRLKKDMRLESCATIQYILGEPKERLTVKDLRIRSPYNTYLNEGLPPGPIANPGSAALRAALQPEQHDYLFFVAREDGSSQHIFSRDFGAHELAMRQVRSR